MRLAVKLLQLCTCTFVRLLALRFRAFNLSVAFTFVIVHSHEFFAVMHRVFAFAKIYPLGYALAPCSYAKLIRVLFALACSCARKIFAVWCRVSVRSYAQLVRAYFDVFTSAVMHRVFAFAKVSPLGLAVAPCSYAKFTRVSFAISCSCVS